MERKFQKFCKESNKLQSFQPFSLNDVKAHEQVNKQASKIYAKHIPNWCIYIKPGTSPRLLSPKLSMTFIFYLVQIPFRDLRSCTEVKIFLYVNQKSRCSKNNKVYIPCLHALYLDKHGERFSECKVFYRHVF